MIVQTNRNQTFQDGRLVAEEVVEVDVTADAVRYDLHDKVRQALTANRAFLDVKSPTNAHLAAQVRQLTRECSAIIRLLVGSDLLDESEDV